MGLKREVNPVPTGNPFLGTKVLGLSIGRGSGASKGLTPSNYKSYTKRDTGQTALHHVWNNFWPGRLVEVLQMLALLVFVVVCRGRLVVTP